MSFASDLGIVVNKQKLLDDNSRQDSEASFLLNLDKCDPTNSSKGDERRMYWRRALSHLEYFLSKQQPMLVGLQEINCWKTIQYDSDVSTSSSPGLSMPIRKRLPILSDTYKTFDVIGLGNKGFNSQEEWLSYNPPVEASSDGGKNKKRKFSKKHRAKKSRSLKK